mmetsp:Transcript_4795/g.7162  ORF Transcript_4795/g.7162 Transcript_4795/m.7162 type:complete len:139 (-) Transcript_4795:142-558(-)
MVDKEVGETGILEPCVPAMCHIVVVRIPVVDVHGDCLVSISNDEHQSDRGGKAIKHSGEMIELFGNKEDGGGNHGWVSKHKSVFLSDSDYPIAEEGEGAGDWLFGGDGGHDMVQSWGSVEFWLEWIQIHETGGLILVS